MKLFPILLLAVSFSGVSCERHEFEGPDGTKQLHEHHGTQSTKHAEGGAEHAEKAAETKH